MISGVINRLKFWLYADRIGIDIPITNWMLHFKSTMKLLCKSKMKYFADTAEIRPGAYVYGCSMISMGERTALRPYTMLYADPVNGSGITIEDDVLIGAGVQIYTDNHRFDNPNMSIIDQGFEDIMNVTLEKGCWIGAGSIILPGVTIGENAVVGAGSVVTKNVAKQTVVAGVPAKIIRKVTAKKMEKLRKRSRKRKF